MLYYKRRENEFVKCLWKTLYGQLSVVYNISVCRYFQITKHM